MVRWVVSTSLRFRVLVLAMAAGLLTVGVMQLRTAPVDVLPEFTPPYVEIQTEALGLSANEVEQLITVPLEANMLNGVAGVETIRSESMAGLSSIVLVFEPDADLYRSRQLVQERLTEAHTLPPVSRPPTMLQPLSSSSRVLMIGLSGGDLSPIERSVLARWTIRPRLMGVPGVANVAIWGQRERQLQVQVDPEELRRRDVTLSQVVSTAGNAQLVSPLTFLEASTPGTGGFIETPLQRLQIRHVLDRIATPEALGRVPLEGTGGKLRLTDVADVVEDHQPLIGDAVVDDSEGLLLVVEKFPGANAVDVTRGVEDALDKLSPGLSGMRADTSVFRPASFISDAIDNLTLALIAGAVLMAVGLAVMLFDWRTALIALVTIPLSLVAAALVLHLRGETINALAFAGLAGAVAFVVDDAVNGVQAVAARRLGRSANGRRVSAESDVLDATNAVRGPIGYAALIALLAVVPVLVMGGRPGAFFEPLALSYVLAVLASTAVALTVTPALALLLHPRAAAAPRESPVVRWLAPRHAGALGRVLRAPRAVLGAIAAAVAIGLAALALADQTAIPAFKDRDVLVRLEAEPGTSQPEMTRIARQLSGELRSIPGVDNVGAHVGRAVTGDRVMDVDAADLWVGVGSGADHDDIVAAVERVVERVEGVEREVTTYSSQEIREVGALDDGEADALAGELDVLTGVDEPLVVRVYGEDPEVLRAQAEIVRRTMAEVDGVVEPRVELPPSELNLEIRPDLARAQRFGIKPGDVRRAEATLLQGIQVGSIFEEQKVFDVLVVGVPGIRRSVADVRRLLLDAPSGGHVRLDEVADVGVSAAPTVIRRDAVSRHVDVEAELSGRGAASVADDVENRLAGVEFPLEYHAEVLTDATGEEVRSTEVAGVGIAAAIAALLLLQAAFGRWRLAALAFATLPLALVGGLLGTLVDGATVSLGSLIGLLALLGLAARNAVLLIRRCQDLEHLEGMAFGPELVVRGTRERLAPVVTTAAATGLLLLPFAVLGARPGLEIVHPMAVVVLGGLVTTTLLTLLLLPALYLRFGGGAGSATPADAEVRRDARPAAV